MAGDVAAMAILARKYQQSKDAETAAHYYSWAGAEAHRAYHRPGQEPLHEMNSLFHADDVDVTLGQAGDDDAWIQFQKMRADVEGDLDAMTAMGDLYYWGARGCVRDHARAFSYFRRAADAGHVVAMSAAGGMLLKGEGVNQNNVTAIAYYEKAAAAHNVRALNGLGYIHFYGSANVTQNQTKGLEYFEAAAQLQSDGDSLFNTGYCYLRGLGTDVNTTRALEYLTVAARSFGHFDAVYELGRFYLGVRPTGNDHRNLAAAMPYLQATTDAGPWGKSARLGFDLYRRREMQGAIWRYHEAHELGYPVATGNLAYLYGLVGGDQAQYLLQAAEIEASLRLGDCYYYGKGGVTKDVRKALAYYTKASADGLSIGAYNAGFLYEHGDDGITADANRARRYYERALELSPSPETYLVVYLSLARMSLGLTSWSTSRLVPVTDDDATTIGAMPFGTVATALTAAMVVGMTMRFWRRS
ncbi:hypothetical protein SPRG_13663 [Saprolegnia parasitica CBS 223.65]|uniref:Uncharacterized protein n=1 Tax=Saprolegnia parasitica (strain CBS 223.65) TaxID=695850 RepID=A0A067C3G7_SAPPC|nr:hypothetical protein SPRG_13663 [Saprolegnia parasitica CBS 223.65]KDO21347.1 hypothetical protein SPRG_13663 [Saprolegnia parasitica CBS 223.65]|eukprot:XP_012207906.1 hypothetical protein SPRG_13663 [Saprolegnia parasitica CBS 223.65]